MMTDLWFSQSLTVTLWLDQNIASSIARFLRTSTVGISSHLAEGCFWIRLASREPFDRQIALLNEKVVGRTSGGWTLTFRFLPDVAIADVAFLARASSLSSLFESSAEALTEVMVDRRSLRPVVEREISLSAEDLDRLLYDFLTQLIILKDFDSLLL